jgi:hypothetical protein
MPTSTSVGAVSQSRTGNSLDNITYTIPITVPSTATAGTITVNGSATIKYTLQLNQGNVVAPTGGTVQYVTPVQTNGDTTNVGFAFYNSPFDAASTRTAVITYTCATTEVLVDNSYVISGFPTGTTPTEVLGNNDGNLVITKVIPVLTAGTIVNPVVDSTVGAATATLGGIPTITLNANGDVQTLTGWNVNGSVAPIGNAAPWFLINGINLSSVPLVAGGSFTVGGQVNATGAIRSTTFSMQTSNSRVTGSLVAPQTITVNQDA